jgi:predicted nuclease with TOPRIM domain
MFQLTTPSATMTRPNSTIDRLQQRHEELQARLEEIEEELNDLEFDKRSTEKELKKVISDYQQLTGKTFDDEFVDELHSSAWRTTWDGSKAVEIIREPFDPRSYLRLEEENNDEYSL